MFETKRLILREWKDEDIAPFAAMNQDPKVMEFFPATLSLDETKALVERIRQHFKTHGFGLFAVEIKETGEFIGFVGLMTPTFEAHFTPCVEIGWRIASAHWKQGYATEAAKMVLHMALEKYGLKEVVSFTAAINLPSIAVMKKIGLQHNPQDDFDHPRLDKAHPLSRHVLYRLTAKELQDRDAILIEPYNPEWPKQATIEISKLKTRLDFPWVVGIQHIGSTAIPDLPAKPIVDLAIGVADLESANALIPILREEDYTFWDDNPDKSKLFFVKGMPPFGEKRTHHIHVMSVTHHDWLLRPLFRDYLIAHPEAKQAYADLKQNLASQYQSDREAYTNSKTTFIRDINRKAVKPHLHFKPLAETDVPLLLKWLEELHVKAWWDQGANWTLDLIKQKYASYINGYKLDQGVKKPIHAYLALIDEMPIAYLQFYNAWDFERDVSLDSNILPKSLAALDIYIGESGFLKKGFTPIILQKFLLEQVKPLFAHCLVDPDIQNTSAIRAYEKAGFKIIETPSQSIRWMLWDSSQKSEIDVALVGRLIAAQFPQWANLPITPVEFSGWDNRTFHLGDHMTVRLPSQEAYAAQVKNEQFWLPKLAPFLPVPIPAPLAMGHPTEDYLWPWSVYQWIEGQTASLERIADLKQFARQLAEFLVAFQSIDTTGGPAAGAQNFYRGGPLSTYDAQAREAITILADELDVKVIKAIWEQALSSTWEKPPVWVHGDIAVGNLLVDQGQLCAVIDFGQLAIGDPACDLVMAWTFFNDESRAVFRSALGLDAATWARARGWVLWKALIVLAGLSGTNPLEVEKSRQVLSAILAEYAADRSILEKKAC